MKTHITRRITALLALVASVFAGCIGLTVHATPAGALGDTNSAVAISGTPTAKGYTLFARDGGIFNFGDSKFYGSMGGKPLAAPIVGGATTPTGKGYTLVASDGGIFNFGDSHFYGSMGGKPLAKPIVGMATTPTGNGYTLVASDGGIFNFGDSHFYGSMGGKPLAAPIVGMAATPTGNGYTLVASDGGIFNFGDSHFYGSMGGKPLAKPIVGMATTPTGNGYTLVASDGGIFNFGDSKFYGSMGGKPLAAPIVGIAATPTGNGYTLVASDGGIFNFGDSHFYGSAANIGTPPVSTPTASACPDHDARMDAVFYEQPRHASSDLRLTVRWSSASGCYSKTFKAGSGNGGQDACKTNNWIPAGAWKAYSFSPTGVGAFAAHAKTATHAAVKGRAHWSLAYADSHRECATRSYAAGNFALHSQDGVKLVNGIWQSVSPWSLISEGCIKVSPVDLPQIYAIWIASGQPQFVINVVRSSALPNIG